MSLKEDLIIVGNDIEELTFDISYPCFQTNAITPEGEIEWQPQFNQLLAFKMLYRWHFNLELQPDQFVEIEEVEND